jgi:rhodanese-related sulfurtransferase
MVANENFAGELSALGVTSDKTALIICRTVNRSPQAATALAALGYSRCYVVDSGFEGQPDEHKHRGARDGWKAAGLPWTQG